MWEPVVVFGEKVWFNEIRPGKERAFKQVGERVREGLWLPSDQSECRPAAQGSTSKKAHTTTGEMPEVETVDFDMEASDDVTGSVLDPKAV